MSTLGTTSATQKYYILCWYKDASNHGFKKISSLETCIDQLDKADKAGAYCCVKQYKNIVTHNGRKLCVHKELIDQVNTAAKQQ